MASDQTALHPLAIVVAVVVTTAAAGAIATGLVEEKRKTRRRRRGSNLSGMEADTPADEPPVDLIYDNRPPCQDVVVPNPSEEEGGFCIPPSDLEPKKRTSAPFAAGGDRPLWPIETLADEKLRVSYQDVRNIWHGKWGRHFGTGRVGDDGRKKLHTGIDLFADEGDIVRAMEDGVVIATLPFHHGTSAVYVLNDSGVIVNYGEVEEGSWREFGIESGVEQGQRVRRGEPIARIGKMRESSMLHLETYEPDVDVQSIRRGDMQWDRDKPAPAGLLDPSRYLVRAQRVMYEATETS